MKTLNLKNLKSYDFVIGMALNDDQSPDAPDFKRLEKQEALVYMHKIAKYSMHEHIQESVPALRYICAKAKGDLEKARAMLYAVCKQNQEQLH